MLDNICSNFSLPVDKSRLFYSDPRVHARDSGQKRLSQLFIAIDRGEVGEVRRMLGSRASKKMPLNSIRKGISPLHFAAHCGNKEIINLLLQSGSDKNNRDQWGHTPYHYAQNKSIEKKLIYTGIQDPSQSELHKAILNYDYRALQHLVLTPQLEMCDSEGRTALHYAVFCNWVPAVELLLEHGALSDPIDKDQKTALHHAIEQKNEEICLLFALHEAGLNTLDEFGRTPLYHVVKWGYSFVLESFLKNGADPHLGASFDLKPLYMAYDNDSFLLLNLLLEYGADLNDKDAKGHSLVNYAVFHKSEEWVRYLISKKANLNTLDRSGCSPLYYAAEGGNIAILQMLLANGANPDLGASNQLKPLFIAYTNDCRRSAELLIEYGTDIHAKDATGRTLIEEIQEYHEEIQEYHSQNKSHG